MRILPFTALLLVSTSVPLWAQDMADPPADELATDIVVTAERIRGSVDTTEIGRAHV